MAISLRGALVIAGVVTISVAAAPSQVKPPGTERPGELTSGRVWVENRNPDEAIPVVLREPVALAQPAHVQAHLVRQLWEYRTIAISVNQDPAGALAGAGTEGWEAVGVETQGPTGTVILLKRPR